MVLIDWNRKGNFICWTIA